MAERSISIAGWPWPVVLILALMALVVMIFVPLLLLVLLPVAAVALITWGYVSYKHAEPAARAIPATAMVGGLVLLALSILLIAGLTVTSSSGEVAGPVQAPASAVPD